MSGRGSRALRRSTRNPSFDQASNSTNTSCNNSRRAGAVGESDPSSSQRRGGQQGRKASNVIVNGSIKTFRVGDPVNGRSNGNVNPGTVMENKPVLRENSSSTSTSNNSTSVTTTVQRWTATTKSNLAAGQEDQMVFDEHSFVMPAATASSSNNSSSSDVEQRRARKQQQQSQQSLSRKPQSKKVVTAISAITKKTAKFTGKHRPPQQLIPPPRLDCVKLKLLTGTLYLYKNNHGMNRRVEFVRRV